MRLEHPWFLVLLLLVPLWIWWERRAPGGRAAFQYSSVAAARGLGSFWTWLGPSMLLLLRGVALVLLVIALARPQLGRSESEVRTEGIDIVLAVDVSGSMQAMDFKVQGQPVDRLTIVKQVVREFIRERVNDRIGMVAFGGAAYIASPLTLDHDWLDRNLDRIRIGFVEDGTAIGAAIGTAAKSKVVILLTDGVNNVDTVSPADATAAAAEFGVRIYTIGAGTQGVAPMPVQDRSGQVVGYRNVPVQIDEELLREVADKTGGAYFRAHDTDSLRAIYRQIDQLEKREIEATLFEEWRELFAWALVPGLGCLVLAVVLEHTRLRRLP